MLLRIKKSSTVMSISTKFSENLVKMSEVLIVLLKLLFKRCFPRKLPSCVIFITESTLIIFRHPLINF